MPGKDGRSVAEWDNTHGEPESAASTMPGHWAPKRKGGCIVDIGLAEVIGLIICMVGAYIIGHHRSSRRSKRFAERIGEEARGTLGQRADIQFPQDAAFLVENPDEYGHGDEPDREALNPFDQQFITWQERFNYPPGTPNADKAEYQYYLIAMEVWEDYETYSFIEDWASVLDDRR